jgi:molecular chaperone IbpA
MTSADIHHRNLFPYTHFSIGMDKAFEQLELLSNNSNTKYPPYNIVHNKDETYVIEIALAGFSKKDIKVEYFDSMLTVKSFEKENDSVVNYLHKGISKRTFQKEFKLSDDIEINNVTMKDGMLLISLSREVPENKKRKIIDIE